MMIDFALDAQRKEKKPPREAIYQAALLRFRPILMTTMAALLRRPARWRWARGSERSCAGPLGIAIVGGLIFSQMLTLYTTPVIYLAFDRLARRVTRRRSASEAAVGRRPGRRGRRLKFSSLSSPFIHRPIATTLMVVAIALAGAIGYRFLPVSPLPQVDFPTISVSAGLPGASPETMASSVATPLERQFGRIAGVTEMTSTSSLGSTNVTLQFDLNRNIDAAARDVQAAINAARGQLPANLPNNPCVPEGQPGRRADHDALRSPPTSSARPRMYDIASTILQQKLAQVQGVGQVFVGGGALPAVRVELNPTALNNAGLALEDVRAALASANANRPKGEVADIHRVWSLSTNDQLLKAGGVPAARRQLPERRRCPPGRHRRRHGLGRGRPHDGAVERQAGDHHHRVPPARREHHRDRRRRPRRAAAAPGLDPALDQAQPC